MVAVWLLTTTRQGDSQNNPSGLMLLQCAPKFTEGISQKSWATYLRVADKLAKVLGRSDRKLSLCGLNPFGTSHRLLNHDRPSGKRRG